MVLLPRKIFHSARGRRKRRPSPRAFLMSCSVVAFAPRARVARRMAASGSAARGQALLFAVRCPTAKAHEGELRDRRLRDLLTALPELRRDDGMQGRRLRRPRLENWRSNRASQATPLHGSGMLPPLCRRDAGRGMRDARTMVFQNNIGTFICRASVVAQAAACLTVRARLT